MEFLMWLTGVMALWIALKFVFLVFKRLGNKNSMNDLIDRAEDGLGNAADKVAEAWKKRKEDRCNEKSPKVTLH